MSNIHFNSLKLNNFMSYEKEEFDFNHSGYILISGINNNPDDNSFSNGSGKSSLFTALCWCLTGETPSGNKKVENIYLDGSTSVEVDFNINNHNYIIRRCKNPSNLYLFIDGENKSGKGIRDSEKLLKEYLPELSSSLINSVIILGQGLPQRFSNNSPSGRKEILEQLSNSDFMISDIKDRIDKRKSILDLEIRQVGNDIVKIETELELVKKSIENNKQKLEDINISELELKLDRLNNENELLNKDIESYIAARDESQTMLDSLIIELQKLGDSYDEEVSKLKLIPPEKLQEDFSYIVSLKSELKYKQDELIKLDSIVDICPTCGQRLPDVHKIDTTELRAECEQLISKIELLEDNLEHNKDYNNELLVELNDKYDEKKKEINDSISAIRYDISNYSNILNDKEFKSKEISTKIVEVEVNINNINSTIETLNTLIANDIDKETNMTTHLVSLRERDEDLTRRIDIINRINNLIKRDFRGYLLTNVIEFISTKCKLYSIKVFGTDNLSFELDGNNILISYDGKEYESLSGGEKQKVDVIIQLAIRDMLCNYLNFSSNILVLDEITDSLDIIGSQNILSLISSELQDVESIYIISHHKDFDIPWDDEITIVKDENKISRIM